MTMDTIRIRQRFQGPTGSGQGGWTASKLVRSIGQPATVGIKALIPLETDLVIVGEAGGWQLVDTTRPEPITILEAARWQPEYPGTSSLPIEAAVEARGRFPLTEDAHPVPYCFSCGLQPDSMRVHAGPAGDGRFAADWQVPGWAVAPDGTVDDGVLWAALDCTAAWYVCCSDGYRVAYTVQFAAEVIQPLVPGAHYALVAWSGDAEPGWDGRKRGAASAAFAADGRCVARSRSFWVAPE